MEGISKEFRIGRNERQDEEIVKGIIAVKGTPDDRRTAEALEAAIYDRLAELEREGELDHDAD